MKKGCEYTGVVKKIKFPNKGIVDCSENGVALLKDVLPGQTVKFVVAKNKRGMSIGRLKKVIQKSPLENTVPRCPHFRVCGGCTYQTLDYERQKALKSDMVKDILDEVINDGYEYEGILGSPIQWHYRNKMEFSFGNEYKDGPLTLGMHKKNSFYDVVTVYGCQIVHEDYLKVLQCVLQYCQEKNLSFYHKIHRSGYLRHLLVRRTTNTEELLVAIVTTSNKEQVVWQELVQRLLKLDVKAKLAGVLHIINDSPSDTVQSDETRVLYGKEYVYEELLGMRFKISVFSFFQTNSLGAEILYNKVREYIGDMNNRLIFDLYSGTGTIAQMISLVAKKVIGIEIVEEAVAAAKENAVLNGLDNCEFYEGDVLQCIDMISEQPDLIILDPPRDGIHPKALKKIIDFGVESMIYISCKPTSLARDLQILQEYGYLPKKVCAVDMFPGTVHVETVCLLYKEII